MQLRSCATNIATRIAEGCGRSTNTELIGVVRKSVSTCSELEYLMLLSKDWRTGNRKLVNG